MIGFGDEWSMFVEELRQCVELKVLEASWSGGLSRKSDSEISAMN